MLKARLFPIKTLTRAKVENNKAKKSLSWKCPDIQFVFAGMDTAAKPGPDVDLDDQLSFAFVFTQPLGLKVLKDAGQLQPRRIDESSAVQGAPQGHAVLEKGAPPGQHVAAAPAAPAAVPVQPKAKATAKASPKGRGRGRGMRRPAAASEAIGAAGQPDEAQPSAAVPGVVVGGKRRRISVPEGVALGCGKCKQDAFGCTTCRPKAGLVETSKGVWVKKD